MSILKRILRNPYYVAMTVVLTLAMASLAYAWTEPTLAPPAGNVAAPINVSATTQSKIGAFSVLGNFGAGTASPLTKLDVSGAGSAVNTAISNMSGGSIILENSDGVTTGSTVGLFAAQAGGGGLPAGIGFKRDVNTDWGTDIIFYNHPAATTNINNLTEVMRIDKNGNVGIGTISPSSRLHIVGGGGGNVDLAVTGRIQTGDGINNGGIWLNNPASMFVGQANSNTYGFYGATGWQLAIGSGTGNVGIGTITPGAKLDVQGGNINTSGEIYFNSSFSTFIGDGLYGTTATPSVMTTPNGGKMYFGYYSDGSGPYYPRIGTLTGTSKVEFGDTAPGSTFTIGTAGSERFRISNTGLVGIGTISPGSPLEIKASRTSTTNATVLTLNDNVTGVQTNGVYKSIRSLSNSGNSISEIRFVETDGTNNNTAIAFATQPAAGGLTERLRIDPSGNVGIGTTSPSQALSVNGVIYSGTGGFKFPDGTTQTTAGGGGAALTMHVQDFTASGSWTPPANVTTAEVFLVGGGGGGGGVSNCGVTGQCAGGGGGGGTVVHKTGYSVTPGSPITITIGAGGAGGVGAVNGSTGGTTSFGALSALGGAGGAGSSGSQSTALAPSGGTGGGGSRGGLYDGGQGSAGGDGGTGGTDAGGGGGACGNGYQSNSTECRAGAGGPGCVAPYDGAFYGGGGGGAQERYESFCTQAGRSTLNTGRGGLGGGGNGGYYNVSPTAGTANTGGGGGGADGSGTSSQNGAAGGSGFVRVIWNQ